MCRLRHVARDVIIYFLKILSQVCGSAGRIIGVSTASEVHGNEDPRLSFRMRTSLVLVLLTVALGPAPILAQRDAERDDLPPRTVPKTTPAATMLLTAESELTEATPRDRLRPLSYHRVHELALRAGQVIVVEVRSRDFDPYLRVEDGTGLVLGENDDISADDRNSRLVFATPADCKVRLIVTTYKGGRTGEYVVQARALAPTGPQQKIERTIGGATDNRREYSFRVPVRARRWYAFHVTSKDFRPQVLIEGSDGKRLGTGGTDRLIAHAMRDETWRVRVQAGNAGRGGAFILGLRVHADPGLGPATAREAQRLAAATLQKETFRLSQAGRQTEALDTAQRCLRLREELFPPSRFPHGHVELARALSNLGMMLLETGEHEKALAPVERALAMSEKLFPPARYPRGHYVLAAALSNLGSLYRDTGDAVRALPYFERSLKSLERLYPKSEYPRGHAAIALVHNNLALVQQSLGQHERALAHARSALDMRRRLHPVAAGQPVHPDVALSVLNLGAILIVAGRDDEARPLCAEAVAQLTVLYPNGHPNLARAHNNLGSIHERRGQYGEARVHLEKALALRRRLPAGHPDLAATLFNLAVSYLEEGRPEAARRYVDEAQSAHLDYARRMAGTAPEAQVLRLLAVLPASRDVYLSAASSDAADVYTRLWPSRALLTRTLRRRQQALRVMLNGNARARTTWEELRSVRMRLVRQALRPGNEAARNRELARLTERKEALERALAALLPELDRARTLDRLGPGDLAAALPAGCAFIDLLRRFDLRAGGRRSYVYTAFVVLPGRTIRRVELGEAVPIDTAIRTWRERIAKEADTPADAAKVGALVWAPLAGTLPARITSVYLAPDGELARLPWAALPGKAKGSLLLEDLALAIVPHGEFLLDRLTVTPNELPDKETVVALGGVDYGPARTGGYLSLPGTIAELRQLVALAGAREVSRLEKQRATWTALQAALPRARYAHLATHGYYDSKSLVEEQRRLQRQLKAGRSLIEGSLAGQGARSPLLYVGLALAGANDPKGDGIVTGEALAGLPLENLRLCVLSACESGLGDLGPVSGEPAQGLPRALHLAGCANVIASLWNVNDRATAALMSRFYHELWVTKRPPLDALRYAQLTLLRHPERIDDLADRGRPDFGKVVRLPVEPRPTPGAPRVATRRWAAFMLSGVGR